ncbi:3-deoxy-D-manno-octulosonic-acid kinase [[Haemophilus] ducreyi]|nr:3-deoxy-D-manno-octulosonic acid kinase [[Haemophilus] ducreyi]VEG83854.1 3-deoxy-D-manno-octulosonic-acid kinase [[Haemophilus] ducreyi]
MPMIHYIFNREIVSPAIEPLLKQLFSGQNFTQSDHLLGYSKGRGITWFLNTQAELGINIVLRHYYRGGLFGKVVKDRYLFHRIDQTRAVQEFNLLTQMQRWHLPVPRPIAVEINKQSIFYRAKIMLEKIEHTQDLSKLLQIQPLVAEQYQQLGQLIRQLHDHQIHHSDLNIHNILLDDNGKFWLIDFDKCGIKAGEEWKQANLNRLLRSFHKEQTRLGIQFHQQNWQSLLTGYQQQNQGDNR